MSTPPSRRDRQWVTARRTVAAALHPDRGGDPEVFIAALAALDTAHGRSSDVTQVGPVFVIVRHPRWRRLLVMIRRTVAHIPGTTHHYAHL